MSRHRNPTPITGRTRAIGWMLALITGGVATVTAGILPASADSPLDAARVQAHSLAVSVDRLQNQAEVASENYDRASASLADAVTHHLQAADRAQVAEVAAATVRAKAGAQARALYQGGGGLTMYAGVLEGGDIGQLAERVTTVHHLVTADEVLDNSAGVAAKAAAALQSAADSTQSQQLTLEDAAASAGASVRSLLAQQSALLAQSTAQVRSLLIQQQQEMARAAAAAFQDRLVAAYAAAGVALQLGSTTLEPAGPVQSSAVAAMQALVAPHPAYVWGGTGPTGYDCSGLTGAAYAAAGFVLPRTAAQQYLSGPHPALTDLRPGDLLFWANDPADPSTIHHVAMYAGGNLMWSTDHTGDVARLQPIWGDGFLGATRPQAATAAMVAGPVWHAGS